MKTVVTFYVDRDGQPLAYFNELMYSNQNRSHRTCYAHIGQHSVCSPDYVRRLKKATPNQYYKLQKELEGIGYDLEIRNER